ncbi:spore coat protein [Calidifontibacillus oryziterrae]|uniref:spore coat protein n=1 Tax=Calidifontibacillus oryziterrae TaxID=1191699 RepID=UPI0003102DF9|nr:spore coat protein [Calidifontibacillus oryziterrae]
MQLASHELYDLHELTMSCVNSITNMACFLNQVHDQQLKSILQKHFPLHVQDYNMKVQFISQANGSNQKLPVPELNRILESFTNTPVPQYPPVQPRTDVQTFNDREIATAYLLTLKRAGREYAWAAMEAANPDLRTFLEDAFRMSSHHAFEVWQWMVQMGYYPLEAAPQPALNTFTQFYEQVPQHERQPIMQ